MNDMCGGWLVKATKLSSPVGHIVPGRRWWVALATLWTINYKSPDNEAASRWERRVTLTHASHE